MPGPASPASSTVGRVQGHPWGSIAIYYLDLTCPMNCEGWSWGGADWLQEEAGIRLTGATGLGHSGG